jgi:hypothetical protein
VIRHIVLTLPEEMPLAEAKELRQGLLDIFGGNQPQSIVNLVWPPSTHHPDQDKVLTPGSAEAYAFNRPHLERQRLESAGFLDALQVPHYGVDPTQGLSMWFADHLAMEES